MEIGDGGNAGGHVVAGDHVLGWDLLRHCPQADAHHSIDEGNEQHHTWSPLVE